MVREMREFDRVREKVVLRLEGRQVGWLVLGGLIVAGAVFTAGYEIGVQSVPSTAPRPVTVLDQTSGTEVAAAASEQPEAVAEVAEIQYTYDRKLTAPSPPVKLDDPTAQLMAEKRREAMAARGADMDLAGPRPADDDVAAAPVLAARQASGSAPVPAPAPGVELASAHEPVQAPDEAAGETEMERAMDRGDEAAVERAREAMQAPTRAPAAARAPSGKAADATSHSYTIQVKAFRARKEARTFMKVLRDAGYKPYLVAADVEGKGRFYRVRMGKFSTVEEARSRQATFEKSEGFATIVTPL